MAETETLLQQDLFRLLLRWALRSGEGGSARTGWDKSLADEGLGKDGAGPTARPPCFPAVHLQEGPHRGTTLGLKQTLNLCEVYAYFRHPNNLIVMQLAWKEENWNGSRHRSAGKRGGGFVLCQLSQGDRWLVVETARC